jgi:signal peptidase I
VSNDDLYIGPTVLAPAPPEPSKLADHLARWIVIPLMILVLSILLVFYVFFSSAVVEGDSMSPTLSSGDYLLVTHGTRGLRRGDVVVTQAAENGRPIELVKRVIGLPGDTVEIRQDVAYVNGRPEPARGQVVLQQFAVSMTPLVVPQGMVYVMGDNRPNSEDSRYLGPLPESGIKGRAVFVFAPINHLRGV